jgi:hypothetical protein
MINLNSKFKVKDHLLAHADLALKITIDTHWTLGSRGRRGDSDSRVCPGRGAPGLRLRPGLTGRMMMMSFLCSCRKQHLSESRPGPAAAKDPNACQWTRTRKKCHDQARRTSHLMACTRWKGINRSERGNNSESGQTRAIEPGPRKRPPTPGRDSGRGTRTTRGGSG